jgi:hypothetical protein
LYRPGEDSRTPSAAVEEVTELFLTRYGARTPDRQLGVANHHYVCKRPGWVNLQCSPKLEAGRPSGEYYPLSQPLIANDLNAVTGISLWYHSFIFYHLDMLLAACPVGPAFRARTQICDRCFESLETFS